MKAITDSKELESLINSRLSMQSNQRTLATVYGVKVPSLAYIRSKEFKKVYQEFDSLKRKTFLTLLAGPFCWVNAANLIEQ